MKSYPSTDLACESYILSDPKNHENGIASFLKTVDGYDVIKTEILNSRGKELTGREIGKYLTLYAGNVYKYTENEQQKIALALSFCIRELLNEFKLTSHSFLVVGLGNRQISSDSLGPLCIDKMTPTHHLRGDKDLYSKYGYDLSLLAPGVLGQSGIEGADLVVNAIKSTGAGCLIVIDSLASKSLDRLCTTIQASNTGVFPGSGAGKTRKEISHASMGVPVISIGVPCVVSASNLMRSFFEGDFWGANSDEKIKEGERLLVSPNNIDSIVDSFSSIISKAITDAIK